MEYEFYHEDPRDKKYIYVVKIYCGKYYIGERCNLSQDARDHIDRLGKQSYIFPRMDILECYNVSHLSDDEIKQEEKILTLEYMKRYGVKAVRGGPYTKENGKYKKLETKLKGINCVRCQATTHDTFQCPYNPY